MEAAGPVQLRHFPDWHSWAFSQGLLKGVSSVGKRRGVHQVPGNDENNDTEDELEEEKNPANNVGSLAAQSDAFSELGEGAKKWRTLPFREFHQARPLMFIFLHPRARSCLRITQEIEKPAHLLIVLLMQIPVLDESKRIAAAIIPQAFPC